MLSICIATYNRAAMLEFCLNNVMTMNKIGLSFEVIVSDNASTDNTSEICEKFKTQFQNFTYYKQTHNVGAGANITSVFRQATGKYTIYLADDDRIKAGNLCHLINTFEENNDWSVLYTNWEVVDDVTGETHPAFNMEGSSVFSKGTAGSLLDFILSSSFHPEIAIYRTALLQKYVNWPSRDGYIYFDLMYMFLQDGYIAITSYDFYTEVTNVKPEFGRGARVGSAYYLDYSAVQQSLEVFINRVLMDLGHNGLSGEIRNVFFEQLNKFYITRKKLSFIHATHTRDYVSAIKNRHTIALWNGIINPASDMEFEKIWAMGAAMQCTVSIFNSLSYLERIIFVGLDNAAEISDLMQNLDGTISFDFSSADNAIASPHHKALYIVCHDADCHKLIDAGIKAGYIIILSDMLKTYGFMPESQAQEQVE